jgi:hypothetical protein
VGAGARKEGWEVVMATEFITVGNQLVRESAVVRLSYTPVAGVEVDQFFVHTVDGGTITVSETEFTRLRKQLGTPPYKKSRRSA